MKAKILTIDGKEKGSIDLPKVFSALIREDVVQKVLEIRKTKQPYGPLAIAGHQYSASGKIKHARHVWKSQYGRGMSRVPRKTMTRKGSQFRWEGASSPNTKGGHRAHPPKPISMINTKKANKKEMKIAFESALSATANKKMLEKKYSSIEKLNKEIPFVVESKFVSLKTKEIVSALKKIVGEDLFGVAIQTKKVRAGVGKSRGRKYKKSAGMLLVTGENEKLKISVFDVVSVKNLKLENLAKGGLGRLTVYTENAIKKIGERK